MRHNRQGRQLSRTASHRKAMMRNLVTSLFQHERITTTLAKAKEGRRYAERLITVARKGDLAARRRVSSYVRSEEIARKLMDDIAPRFEGRPGGYTRIFKMGPRRGDAGELAILELVERKTKAKGEGGEKDSKAKSKKAAAGKETKAAKASKAAKGAKKATESKPARASKPARGTKKATAAKKATGTAKKAKGAAAKEAKA